MFNRTPCHTSQRITDDNRSPDYIDNEIETEEWEVELSVTFEEVLAITKELPEDDVRYCELTEEEIKENGFDWDEIMIALGRKFIAEYTAEFVREYEYEIDSHFRGSTLEIAKEVIEQFGQEQLSPTIDEQWEKDGVLNIVFIVSKTPDEACAW